MVLWFVKSKASILCIIGFVFGIPQFYAYLRKKTENLNELMVGYIYIYICTSCVYRKMERSVSTQSMLDFCVPISKIRKACVESSLEFACLLDASHAKGNVHGTFNYQFKLPIWTILLITHFFSSHLGTSLWEYYRNTWIVLA
jgi:hypothetical protein